MAHWAKMTFFVPFVDISEGTIEFFTDVESKGRCTRWQIDLINLLLPERHVGLTWSWCHATSSCGLLWGGFSLSTITSLCVLTVYIICRGGGVTSLSFLWGVWHQRAFYSTHLLSWSRSAPHCQSREGKCLWFQRWRLMRLDQPQRLSLLYAHTCSHTHMKWDINQFTAQKYKGQQTGFLENSTWFGFFHNWWAELLLLNDAPLAVGERKDARLEGRSMKERDFCERRWEKGIRSKSFLHF